MGEKARDIRLFAASPVWLCASRELAKAGKGIDAAIQFQYIKAVNLMMESVKRVLSEF